MNLSPIGAADADLKQILGCGINEQRRGFYPAPLLVVHQDAPHYLRHTILTYHFTPHPSTNTVSPHP
jgi:hypothetical protein